MEQFAEYRVEQGPDGPKGTLAKESGRRVLVLWAHVPHYLAACLRVLLADYGAQVFLVALRTDEQSNHVPLQAFAGFQYVALSAEDALSEVALIRRIRDFGPEVVVASCSRWGVLTRLANAARMSGARALWATDHYWRGSWRDYANAVCCRLGLAHRFWDGVWVPGSLGRLYVRKLGFEDGRISEGMYACDTELFRTVGIKRFESPSAPWPRVFLFVGRYIECKNLPTLLTAYSQYRDRVAQPWELWCAGGGPFQELLRGRPGVRDCGFQNAAGCAALMSQAGAFVLPSWVDHWGVVIHEAACAGLPILASRTCGATANLVRDGYNGFTFVADDAAELCRLMQLLSQDGQAALMGRNSVRMSWQFDPRLWARTLLAHTVLYRGGRDGLENAVGRAPHACKTTG
jgi:glycosyltransferase involved in cell wall biosynthesis